MSPGGSERLDRGFPDVETFVQDLLADIVGGQDHVGSVTPSYLDDVLPFFRVTRYGGADDGITDQPDIDVDTYASDRDEALRLAKRAHERLISGPHSLDGVNFDRFTTITGPMRPPGDEDDLVRITAAYSGRARRTRLRDGATP